MAFLVVLFFIVGSAFGSFLNVFVDKIIVGRSLFGRSCCDHCKRILAPWDLVPIFSYLVLGGRCRYCKRPISLKYPIVEATSGFMFAAIFYFEVASGSLGIASLVYLLAISAVFIVVAVVDFRYYLIPTTLVFGASLMSLFYNFITFDSQIFVRYVAAAFAASIFFGAIVLFTRGRGMGSGDIVLGFLIGMVLGIERTVLAIFMAFLIGALVSLFLIFIGRKKFRQTIAFGPFLVAGFYISLFWYNQIVSWYLGRI